MSNDEKRSNIRSDGNFRYTCVGGHDKCHEMYPGPECPYCEKTTIVEPVKEKLNGADRSE